MVRPLNSATILASSRAKVRPCACVMAMASASASSALSKYSARQKMRDHGADLILAGVTCADHSLLHRIRRIFGDRQSEQCRYQHCDAPRLAELQRGAGIAIDESLLDRGLLRLEPGQNLRQPIEELPQAHPEALGLVRLDRATSDEAEPHPVIIDDAPAGPPQARVDTDNADAAHGFGQEGPTPSRAGRKSLASSVPRRHPPGVAERRRAQNFVMTGGLARANPKPREE